MGVMGHGRAPGMQHQGRADAGTQMQGVGPNREQGLGGCLEQQVVEQRLVVPGERADRRRQGEDEVVVLDRQELRLALFEPAPGGTGLTLGAVAVATGVAGDRGVLAGIAVQQVASAKRARGRGRSARPPGRGVPRLPPYVEAFKDSRGLVTSRSTSVATWV
jgi:hypothetical protein